MNQGGKYVYIVWYMYVWQEEKLPSIKCVPVGFDGNDDTLDGFCSFFCGRSYICCCLFFGLLIRLPPPPPTFTLSATGMLLLLTFRPALIPVEFVSILIFGNGRFVAAWTFNESDGFDGVVIVIDSLTIGVDGVDDDCKTNVVVVVISFNVICLVYSRCVTVSLFPSTSPTFG